MSTNEKATGGQPVALNESTSEQFNPKSSLTEAQYARIIRMLHTGPKTTFDFRRAGIMAPAARIKELNDHRGFYIPTVAVRDLYDDEGYRHPRVAVYELVDEPGRGYGERPQP